MQALPGRGQGVAAPAGIQELRVPLIKWRPYSGRTQIYFRETQSPEVSTAGSEFPSLLCPLDNPLGQDCFSPVCPHCFVMGHGGLSVSFIFAPTYAEHRA